MEILITQWAFDSYLDLINQKLITRREYFNEIRPDVMRLKYYPKDTKFQNGKFWSPANDRNGAIINNGYKMKWHQMGNGKMQLRLTVGIFGHKCFLCDAYIKTDDKTDKRKLAKFKVYLTLIQQGGCMIRGRLA